ncbi:hypothetical protein [Cronobacter dublinensis]|uniref:hypothetical protein n=1 Tax=Cronobacter dublinensis TaxID=413497 RepID=UPI000576B9E2|nr:hypothetical protein [Cronobacter dublinensis]ALB67871.1 hypothetical protein AFK67_15875 [Cronobacter dublinensis subsp. dublinensis LMG 23823]MDI7272710.1 hypothetical protein [Cronobacter dublinensis]
MLNSVFFKKISTFNAKLDSSQKVIRNLIISMFILYLLSLSGSEKLWKGFFIITLMYWSYAVVSFLIKLYKKAYETTLGKGILILAGSICVNLALCFSGIIINDITSVSPSNFPHSLIFIATAMIPLIIPIVMSLPFTIILITLPLWGWFFVYDEKLIKFLFPGYQPNNKTFLHKVTLLIQMFLVVVYWSFLFHLATLKGNDYMSYISYKSQWLIYNLEMFDKSKCSNFIKGKVAFIGDDKILVATNQNETYSFKLMECEAE